MSAPPLLPGSRNKLVQSDCRYYRSQSLRCRAVCAQLILKKVKYHPLGRSYRWNPSNLIHCWTPSKSLSICEVRHIVFKRCNLPVFCRAHFLSHCSLLLLFQLILHSSDNHPLAFLECAKWGCCSPANVCLLKRVSQWAAVELSCKIMSPYSSDSPLSTSIIKKCLNIMSN